MGRFRAYSARDEQETTLGDGGFVGVDCRRDPRLLEPGLCAWAENKNFRQGIAETRRGFQTVRWGEERGIDFPVDFLIWGQKSGYVTDAYGNYSIANYTEDTAYISKFTSASIVSKTLSPARVVFYGAELRCVLYDPTDPESEYVNTVSAQQKITISNNAVYTDLDGTYIPSEVEINDQNVFATNTFAIPVSQDVVTALPTPPLSGFGHFHVYAWGVLSFSVRCGFGTVYGVGVFSDPYGQEGLLVVKANGTYRIRKNQEPLWMPFPQGHEITAPVQLLQAFDRVLMFRGPDAEPLVWNPRQDFSSGVREWETVTMTNARGSENTSGSDAFGDGVEAIPNSVGGCVFANRVFAIVGRDEIAVSDLLDYTRYSTITNRFRINSGSDDNLVRLIPFNQTQLVAFKDQSIHILSNVYGDLGDIRADTLTAEYGCLAQKSAVVVGKDVWFYSEGGFYAVSQALDNKLQASIQPISGPIQPIVDRVNPNYAESICCAYHENRFFAAVPLDGATVNNAVLVYDFINQAWSGIWTFAHMDIIDFARTDCGGKRRLFAVQGNSSGDAQYDGALLLMDSGFDDDLCGEHEPIADVLLTRGYAVEPASQGHGLMACVDMATWSPCYSVTAEPDGVEEAQALATGQTLSREETWVWGEEAYDTTNASGDHARPYRKDYSVDLAAGTSDLWLTNGVDPQIHQRHQKSWPVSRRGQYVQIRLTNTAGRVRVHAASMSQKTGKKDYSNKV